ncbi:class I SAM-dependent methyltransferase [Candidatus Sumerlaeota bacterium]|nr:class I SAM-dependent methyltransferase [Candidatus Sumerlaeota bacterium]
MRESLCSLLRCPVCASEKWSVETTASNPREILSGVVRCGGCGREFPLQNGAADLVLEEELGDLRRADRDRAAQSDLTILELKRRGEFVGEPRRRAEVYQRETYERTDFFFRNIEYDNPSQHTVLDLGSGEPSLATRFAQAGFNVIALDFTFPRLDLAHEYFDREGVYFERILGMMTKIPLRDHSMDIVFFHASLHHATPHRAEDFRWFDPRNMLDTLREIKRVLKPDGLFLVSGEGEYPEEFGDKDRHLEREAQRTGCYEAFYKISQHEWAFREAGIFPNLWAQSVGNKLQVATFRDGHHRPIVTSASAVNTKADLLLSAPALKREIDACLGGWARVRPWPSATRVPRSGIVLPIHDDETFVSGWCQPEGERENWTRWMGREPAAVVFELEFAPLSWQVEIEMRACWFLEEFDRAVFVERQGKVIAKRVEPASVGSTSCDQETRLDVQLDAGPSTIRCIHDGRMRVRLYFNGDFLDSIALPSDTQFHTSQVVLPAPQIRALNQLTLEPSYALRPCDCGVSRDDRWLSCQVRSVRISALEAG